MKGIVEEVGDAMAPVPVPKAAREELPMMGYLPVGVGVAVAATAEVTGIKPTAAVEAPSVEVVKPTMGTVTVMEEYVIVVEGPAVTAAVCGLAPLASGVGAKVTVVGRAVTMPGFWGT